MPQFNNITDLLKYIELKMPISLEIIGEEIKKILRNNVEQLWYDRPYTPTHYSRTMEYVNSITCSNAIKIGSGYEVTIYFDTDKINPYPSTNGEWPQHESVYGENTSASIPYYIEEGNKSPLFSYEGVHPVEITKDWLREYDYLKKRMIELLGSYGFVSWIR